MELFDGMPIDKVIAQRIRIRWRWDGEDRDYILYMNPFSGHINVLNPVGADVFVLCDGKHTISGIVDSLMEKYEGATREYITADILDMLRHFRDEHLVTFYS